MFTPGAMRRLSLFSGVFCGVKPCEDWPCKITPQRTPQHWRNIAKLDKCQLCSVRRFGHGCGRPNGSRSARLRHLTPHSPGPVAKSPYWVELTFVHLCGVFCGVIWRGQSSQGLTRQKTPQKKTSLVMDKMWSKTKCSPSWHGPVGFTREMTVCTNQTDMTYLFSEFVLMSSIQLFEIFCLSFWSIRSELEKKPSDTLPWFLGHL